MMVDVEILNINNISYRNGKDDILHCVLQKTYYDDSGG